MIELVREFLAHRRLRKLNIERLDDIKRAEPGFAGEMCPRCKLVWKWPGKGVETIYDHFTCHQCHNDDINEVVEDQKLGDDWDPTQMEYVAAHTDEDGVTYVDQVPRKKSLLKQLWRWLRGEKTLTLRFTNSKNKPSNRASGTPDEPDKQSKKGK